MINFNNQIGSVGQVFQAGSMTFGEVPRTEPELKRQLADLKELLGNAELPEATRAPVREALDAAEAIPATEPAGKGQIVAKLESARGFLQAATDVTKQVGPLIGAIGAVIGAVMGFGG